MKKLEYTKLDNIDPDTLIAVLNKNKIRKHLIQHDLFDKHNIKLWLEEKHQIDLSPHCKVRAILLNHSFIGWCGIQYENDSYELAIVLDDQHWGVGKTIFNDLISWAKQLGHSEVYIHLLSTRPRYKFLSKLASSVNETTLLNNTFTRYQFSL